MAVLVPIAVATADGSGTITAGGTSQTLFAANRSRKWFFFYNASDIDLWINFGAAANADQPSIKVAAGGTYREDTCVAADLITVFGITTGKKFTAKQR